jgi:hypothetical protein
MTLAQDLLALQGFSVERLQLEGFHYRDQNKIAGDFASFLKWDLVRGFQVC